MKRTVLVVDDSRVTQHMLKLILRRSGYKVTVAGDGSAGLAQLEKQRVDLIISDINMPILNGFDMVREVRADNRFSHLPIVMLTATGDDKNQERARNLGVEHFITQPFDSHELVETVNGLITA